MNEYLSDSESSEDSGYPDNWLDCIKHEIKHFETRTPLSPMTIKYYEAQQSTLLAVMEKHGRNCLPYEINETDIRWLLFDYFESRNFAVKTRKGYITSLAKIMEYYDNYSLKKMGIQWSQDTRPTVDWLTKEEAQKILSLKMTPLQAIGLNFMLCMGLRRCEVLRLWPSQLHLDNSYVEIVGKGRAGGKWRNIPSHRDTPHVLEEFDAYRQELVDRARKKSKIPPELVIWCDPSSGKLNPYSVEGWGWDKSAIVPLRKKSGIHFSNHTLRRTFGREMYKAGVDIVTISRIFGHDSIEVTIRYLGINMDDMQTAMSKCPF